MEQFSFNAIPDCKCVYKISNTSNEKVYIGSTTNLNARIIQHRYDSKNRPNNCPKLYNAINTIGSDKFIITIIEKFNIISVIELHNKESYYIDKYNSIENGYNERKDINGHNIITETTSQKMSKSSKNVWARGGHKNHAEKLSKFNYNIYDLNNNIIESNVLSKQLKDKYGINSSNIFVMCRNKCFELYSDYDETKTIKIKIKGYILERIYHGGTTRGNYKGVPLDKMTFSFDNNK